MNAVQSGTSTIPEEEQVRILFGRDSSDLLVKIPYNPALFTEMSEVSEGTYAKVYSAKNTQKEKVILKINKIVSYRFDLLEEGHILARITARGGSDYGIVRHLGVWINGDETILAQEHLGSSLKNVLENGPLSIQNIKKYAIPLFQALYFLQNVAYEGASILHRDIKPANLVFAPSRALFKLIDFNTATVLKEGKKCSDFEVSTPAYRAPEVFNKKEHDTSIDTWALGVVLTEMFTGKLLMDGKNDVPTIITELFGTFSNEPGPPRKKRKIENSSQPKIHQVLSKTDPAFKDLILKMLHLDPEQRLQPADALQHPFLED